MAFSDWDLYVLNNVTITPETSSPLEGSQCLAIEKFTGGTITAGGLVVASDASGKTKGITAGRMRTLMRQQTGSVTASDSRAGIYFMTANENPVNSGACYSAGIDQNGAAFIRKHSVSLISTSGSLLASVSSVIADPTVVFAFEVMWFYDLTEFNGIKIVVSTGAATDFSDMTPVVGADVIDSVSPLSTTNSEGLFYVTTAGITRRWLFDKTRLYSLTLV